ncbi:MAG: hypothetical protein SGPRY_014216 [Prymnesium sp.]
MSVESDLLFDSCVVLALCGGVVASFVLDSAAFGISGARLTAKMRSLGIRSFMRQESGRYTRRRREQRAEQGPCMHGCVQALLRMGTCIVTLLLFTFLFGPWQLALSLFGMLPAMVLMILLLMITLLGGKDKLKKHAGQDVGGEKEAVELDAGRLMGEVVLSIRTVASFTAEERFYHQYCISAQRMVGLDIRTSLANAFIYGLANGTVMQIFAFMYYYGMWLITVRKTDFTGMEIPVFMMMGGMMTIIGGLSSLKDPKIATAAASRFFDAVDRESSIDPSSSEGAQLSSGML